MKITRGSIQQLLGGLREVMIIRDLLDSQTLSPVTYGTPGPWGNTHHSYLGVRMRCSTIAWPVMPLALVTNATLLEGGAQMELKLLIVQV